MDEDRDADATIRALSNARANHAVRAFAQAEAFYRDVIERDPLHVEALCGLAAIAVQRGRVSDALAYLEAALSTAPTEHQAALHEGLGTLRRRNGQAEQALTHYRAAARLEPNSHPMAMNFGAALADAGSYREAAEAFLHAERLQPTSVPSLRALAAVLNRLGRHEDAAAASRRGLFFAPDDEPLIRSLAHALKEIGRVEAAISALSVLVDCDVPSLEATYELGLILKDDGRTAEAVECFRRLVVAEPGFAAARVCLCMAHLPPIPADEQERVTSRAAFESELRALELWADNAPVRALAPAIGASQPFYLAYQGEEDVGLQARYGSIITRAAAAAFPTLPSTPFDENGRIRIGIVSGHFREHSVWRVPTRGWVETLDRTRFEVFGYHTSALVDDTTVAASRSFDRFNQGPFAIAEWRRRIEADRLHVLIYPEIGMDPMVLQLAAQRLATIQCTSWGHPVTSGLTSIDYFLSSADMEPAGAAASYTERLIRLPRLSAPCHLPELPDERRGKLSARPAGEHPVFWCAQSPQKYLPKHDDIFARIASSVGSCRFVFSAFPGSDRLTERFRLRLMRAFDSHGLAGSEYIEILPRLDATTYRSYMARSDVFLDSIGWSSCNSLLEALACGLPVLTLAGSCLRARHGAAILRLCGLGAFVCHSEEEYIEAAQRLAAGGRLSYPFVDREHLTAALQEPSGTRYLENVLISALKYGTLV